MGETRTAALAAALTIALCAGACGDGGAAPGSVRGADAVPTPTDARGRIAQRIDALLSREEAGSSLVVSESSGALTLIFTGSRRTPLVLEVDASGLDAERRDGLAAVLGAAGAEAAGEDRASWSLKLGHDSLRGAGVATEALAAVLGEGVEPELILEDG